MPCLPAAQAHWTVWHLQETCLQEVGPLGAPFSGFPFEVWVALGSDRGSQMILAGSCRAQPCTVSLWLPQPILKASAMLVHLPQGALGVSLVVHVCIL